MITPTVGRVVHYYPRVDDPEIASTGPLAALVVFVHSETLVNLTVFGWHGDWYKRSSVRLVQPGEELPASSHARWMKFQIDQAAAAGTSQSQSAEPRPA